MSTLQLRVGLNSGQVIAGEIGSGALGYTAVGEQVGMAQRMESVAPPGGVMLSASTARLVEGAATLGESRVGAYQGRRRRRYPPVGCWAWPTQPQGAGRAESDLVGRRWEMSALSKDCSERAVDGHGTVLGVGGAAGYRQEPSSARNRSRWRTDVKPMCLPPSASRIPAKSHFMWWLGYCARPSAGEGFDGQAARDRARERGSRRRPRGHAAAR